LVEGARRVHAASGVGELLATFAQARRWPRSLAFPCVSARGWYRRAALSRASALAACSAARTAYPRRAWRPAGAVPVARRVAPIGVARGLQPTASRFVGGSLFFVSRAVVEGARGPRRHSGSLYGSTRPSPRPQRRARGRHAQKPRCACRFFFLGLGARGTHDRLLTGSDVPSPATPPPPRGRTGAPCRRASDARPSASSSSARRSKSPTTSPRDGQLVDERAGDRWTRGAIALASYVAPFGHAVPREVRERARLLPGDSRGW